MTTATAPAAPAPTNGAAKTTPQTPVAPTAPPATAEHPELKAARARAEKAEQLAAQKTREEIINRRKYEGERKTFAEKLKAADEYERLKKEARINKSAVARQLWGEKWQEELNTEMANGGSPSPEAILYDNEQREQRLRKEFEERDQKRNQAQAEAEQLAIDARVRNFRGELLEAVKAKGSEFPLTAQQFKSPEAHADAVFNFIVNEHARTTQKDEDGNVLRQGRAMSFDEAAAALEEQLFAIADSAAGNEKYAEKLRARLTPAKTPGTVPPVVKSSPVLQQGQSSQSSQQARRTLGNDLTGSTPSAPSTYRSEEQRTADALAAYERNKKT